MQKLEFDYNDNILDNIYKKSYKDKILEYLENDLVLLNEKNF